MPRERDLRERLRGWSSVVGDWFESLGSWLTGDRVLRLVQIVIALGGLLFGSLRVFFGENAVVFGPRIHYVVHEELATDLSDRDPIVLNGCTVTNEGQANASNVTVRVWADQRDVFGRDDLTATGAEGQKIEQDGRNHFYISIPRLAGSESFKVTARTKEPIDFHCTAVDDSGVGRPETQSPFRLLAGDFMLLLGVQLLLGIVILVSRSK